jgi:uncharacterized integral membrane protein
MRLLCFLFLLAFGGVVAILAYQNQQTVELDFFQWKLVTNVAALAGAAYGLGMLSGWTIVGMLRRSFHRITEYPVEERGVAATRG